MTLALLLACQEQEQGQEPDAGEVAANLLVISLDTTRADHVSAYGYSRTTSPRIDELAAGGHRFEAAYTTIPSTLPSHAAMFTSLYPTSLGVTGNEQVLAAQAHTLAERLQEARFETGAFVSSAPLDRATGIDQGFATFGGPDDRAVDRAVEWLGGLPDTRFFCFVHLFDPHTRYLVHPELPEEFSVPPGAYPGERGLIEDRARFTAEHVRHTIAAYDGEIRYADAAIGRLLDALDAQRLREKTVVVFISDHGETLDEILELYGYGFDHGEFLYRRELRIPFVVWLPAELGGVGGRVHTDLVSTLDLMPTLLELAGLPCAAPCEGRSLVPLLRGGSLEARPVISERRFVAGSRELSVVDGRWHWIHTERAPDELYDLHSDPDERSDVIQRHPEVVERLRPLLRDWEKAHGRPRWPPPPFELRPALRNQLEGLGYLGEDAPATRGR